MYLKLEKNIIKGSKGNFKHMNKEGKDNCEGHLTRRSCEGQVQVRRRPQFKDVPGSN